MNPPPYISSGVDFQEWNAIMRTDHDPFFLSFLVRYSTYCSMYVIQNNIQLFEKAGGV